MVKKIWLLLLCAACSGGAMAETRLMLKADKKTSALGEPLTVEVKAEDSREPLSSIHLDQLKQDFNVYGVASNVRTHTRKGRSVSSETMTLTLYPLRSGKLHLPALTYRGKRSTPLPVTITEAGSHTQKMVFKTAFDITRLHVRQEATLTLDIYDDGSLQWTAPREIVAAGAHQRFLAESQREEALEGNRYTVHRYAWALMPLREGRLTVEFPMLDAFKFGTRLRYPVSPVQLDVAAVPAYLPVHVPIGKLLLKVEPLPAEIALGQPLNWTFSVQGSGISKEGLGKLLPALRSNDAMRFYPFSVNLDRSERATSAMQTLQVTIPFVPLRSGTSHMPEIIIPYYDPASARVESVLIPAARLAVFNPLWHTVLHVVAGLLLLAASLGVGYWLYRKIRRMQKRRSALQAIARADTMAALQQALLNFETECRAIKLRTLQQWLLCMQQHFDVNDRLRLIVETLEGMQYGLHAKDSVAALAREAALLLVKLPLEKKVAGSWLKLRRATRLLK